ncbi:MAG: hypothetical protein WA049_11645 [Ferribacterium limneticum]
MPTGSVQSVLTCTTSANKWLTQAPCPSGHSITVTQAYLLDPSQKAIYETLSAPFDYAYASGVWGLGFSSVVVLYLVARSAGTILDFIKR